MVGVNGTSPSLPLVALAGLDSAIVEEISDVQRCAWVVYGNLRTAARCARGMCEVRESMSSGLQVDAAFVKPGFGHKIAVPLCFLVDGMSIGCSCHPCRRLHLSIPTIVPSTLVEPSNCLVVHVHPPLNLYPPSPEHWLPAHLQVKSTLSHTAPTF